jgi:hypothetical protein
MKTSRRKFFQVFGAAGAAALLAPASGFAAAAAGRTFHLSISTEALDADPELLGMISAAGITDVWIGGFLYGHWYYSLDMIRPWRRRIERQGMAAHVINVSLGHPGDSLGSRSGRVPLTPPPHWKMAVLPDGNTYCGTSLHEPATAENCQALRRIQAEGVKRVFLDDDFRLARGPGIIGGCFCPEHKKAFLRRTGLGEPKWDELLADVRRRRLTPLLRAWVDFTCDQLTACFRAQQKAAPQIQLGTMVMYFGAEKAGIRLTDYGDVPARVGELMFCDDDFGRTKGKTDELFSVLFHRRFFRPELAYSETTAYPAHRLSARNMAAKLATSTIADVRNTMFMSGLTAFPREHWRTLGPAMKRHARLHQALAGQVPRGPLKHFWGRASRYVGDDNAFSLFLALGVPFEVTAAPAADGWTFLSDADALAVDQFGPAGTRLVARPQAGLSQRVRQVPESLPELFSLKREMLPQLQGERIPYVEGETPAVCAWYPAARAVLLWNLTEQPQQLMLRCGAGRRSVHIDALDVALIEEAGQASRG